jgi:hypothetical protein
MKKLIFLCLIFSSLVQAQERKKINKTMHYTIVKHWSETIPNTNGCQKWNTLFTVDEDTRYGNYLLEVTITHGRVLSIVLRPENSGDILFYNSTNSDGSNSIIDKGDIKDENGGEQQIILSTNDREQFIKIETTGDFYYKVFSCGKIGQIDNLVETFIDKAPVVIGE